MISAFVINIAESRERMARMRSVFEEHGLALERLEAVDAKHLSTETVHELTRSMSYRGRALDPREVACFLSHRKAWQIVHERQLSHVAIFEDDIHFSQNAGDILSAALKCFPKDSDVIKLETLPVNTHVGRRGQPIPGASNRFHRLYDSHYGSAGYILKARAVETLLFASDEITMPLDDFLFSTRSPVFSKLKIYQLSPAICIQDQFLDESDPRKIRLTSEIDQQNVERETQFQRPATQRRFGSYVKNKFLRRTRKIRFLILRAFRVIERKKIPFGE